MAANNQGNPGAGTQDGKQATPRSGSTRGFASMDPERQRQIASQGGRAAHEKGTAHQFTPEEARQAGSKGGKAAHLKGTAHQFDSEEARAAGRKGGLASSSANQAASPQVGTEAEAEADADETTES